MSILGHTNKQMKQWLNLQKKKGPEWEALQKIWVKDFLVGIVLGVGSAFVVNRFGFQPVGLVLFLFLLVGYVLLWVNRSGAYPKKYSWWKGWMLVTMTPYGVVVFFLAYAVTLLIL